MTLGEVTGLLAIAGRNYDKATPEGMAEDWQRELADVPENVGVAALRAHIRASERFPTIANILAYVEAVKPRPKYLPPRVEQPIPNDELRGVFADMVAKLKGRRVMSYETCRAAFDADIGTPSTDPWTILQNQLYRWQVATYGLPKSTLMALGVLEELGELATAKTYAEVEGELSERNDAIADVTIYAVQLATCFRLDAGVLARVAREACGRKEQKTTRLQPIPMLTMLAVGGALAHVVLKADQKIRGMGDPEAARRAGYEVLLGIFEVCQWCVSFVSADEYLALVQQVAAKVMARKKTELPQVVR